MTATVSEKKFRVIAGPCVIEDEGLAFEVASELKRQLTGLETRIDFWFKASFDKANRTSIEGFRGPGLESGLQTLAAVRSRYGQRVLTDIHESTQVLPAAEVVDALQIPAFLCRQTDLIVATAQSCARFGRSLNVKKGQFLAPWDARNIVQKVRETAPGIDFTLTERGVSFGYNSLIVDMASFQTMQGFGVPVIYDATHSIQVPGLAPGGKSTGGRRENLEVLARAAVAAGADGVFLECHPDPSRAKSDGPNAFYLESVGVFVRQLLEIHDCVRRLPKLLPEAIQHGTKTSGTDPSQTHLTRIET